MLWVPDGLRELFDSPSVRIESYLDLFDLCGLCDCRTFKTPHPPHSPHRAYSVAAKVPGAVYVPKPGTHNVLELIREKTVPMPGYDYIACRVS